MYSSLSGQYWWAPISSGKPFQWFSGCAHHGLDLFAHILTPPTLQLDFGSSVQCSDAGLCLCFHQLLDEGSMEGDISDIHQSDYRASSVQVPSPLLLRVLTGLILVDSWMKGEDEERRVVGRRT